MKSEVRDWVLALGGLAAVTVLAMAGKVEGAAVVTFLGGLFVRNPVLR